MNLLVTGTLFSPVLQSILNGIDSVTKVTRDHNIRGVHGPLIKNFTCEPRMFTAVEVTAGKRSVWFMYMLTQQLLHIINVSENFMNFLFFISIKI